MTTRVTVFVLLAAGILLCTGARAYASDDTSGASTGAQAPASDVAAHSSDVVAQAAPSVSGHAASKMPGAQPPRSPSHGAVVPLVRKHPLQILRTEDGYVFPEVDVRALKPTFPFSTKLDRQVALRTPATFSDPVRAALLALPGVTPRDELFARPSVNGGLPDWLSVNYGGFADANPYVLYGTVSIANSQFDELRLLKGAFPVEYGDALSGVVLLEPRMGTPAAARGGASLDLLRSAVYSSGPFNQGSYAVSVETSFYDKVLGQFTDNSYPGSSSLLARVTRRFGPREISLRAYEAIGGSDTRIEPGEDRYTSANTASRTLKGRYEVSLSERRSRTTHATSLALFTDSERFDALNGFMGREQGVLSPFSAKVDLATMSVGLLHKTSVTLTPANAVDVGASVKNERLGQYSETEGWNFIPLFNTGRDDVTDTSLAHVDQTLRLWRYAFYVQDRSILAGYRVTLGARCDVLNSSASPVVRASVERQFGKCTLRLAGGQYSRFPLSGTFAEGRIARLTQSYTEPESAVHLLMGADVDVGYLTLSVDLQRQRYSHLVVYDEAGQELRNGRGHLRAVDLTLSTPRTNESFWAYATASVGETRVMGLPTAWDQKVVGKAVCFVKPRPSLELTARAYYSSGLAYTPLLGRESVASATGETMTDAVGNEEFRPVWGEDFSGRLPAQFRLDFRVATIKSVFSRKLRFFVEGLNLTNHKNVSGVDYFDYYSRTVYRTNAPRAANLGVELYF